MNRAHAGAWKKGRKAALEGKPRSACPYEDHRTNNGRNSVTWSRTFMVAWDDGWLNRGPYPPGVTP